MIACERHGSLTGTPRALEACVRAIAVLATVGILASCYQARKPPDAGEAGASGAMASSVPEIYQTGDEIKREMLRMIEASTDYILIDTFLLSADEATADVLEALKRKHHAGVRICVLTDSSSVYLPGGKEGIRFFEDAGIPVAEFNPMRFYKAIVAPAMLTRDHRKFWIVDGRTLFLGGANLFATSLKTAEQHGNRDLMVKVESAEAIRRMTESFVTTWNRSSTLKLDAVSFRVRARNGGKSSLWLTDQVRVGLGSSEVAKLFEDLYARAENEIWLVQPYTFVTPGIVRDLRKLSRRGVTVNVMLSSMVQSPRFHYAACYGIKDLLEAGAKVWIYRSEYGPLHAKAILVDRRWALVGSANLNLRSFHLSKEANVVFGDAESVGEVVQVVDGLKERCRPVDMAEAKRYRGVDYAFVWMWMQLGG